MIYIPYFITAAAMGVIFRWMFMSNWGIIDQICRMIGISTPGWLDSPFWSRVVIILGEVFQNTPFSVIILYAGLQSMPLDQIEAAKIDGANNGRIQIIRQSKCNDRWWTGNFDRNSCNL